MTGSFPPVVGSLALPFSARPLASRCLRSTFGVAWCLCYISYLPVPRLAVLQLTVLRLLLVKSVPFRALVFFRASALFRYFILSLLRVVTSLLYYTTFPALRVLVPLARGSCYPVRLSCPPVVGFSPPVVSSLLGSPVDGSCPPVVGFLALRSLQVRLLRPVLFHRSSVFDLVGILTLCHVLFSTSALVPLALVVTSSATRADLLSL